MYRLVCISAALWVFGSTWPAHALNQSTHRIINVQAALTSPVDSVLREDLRLTGGVLEPIRGRRVTDWLGEGGIREDDTLGVTGPRFLRHFHDPLARASSPLGHPWDEAGLFAFGTRWTSSIRWMQESDWSWGSARGRLALALTLPDPRERERLFAELFRNLGQVMHLVVDASVPEHVRQDMHPGESLCRTLRRTCHGNYEYWVSDRHSRPGTEAAFVAEFLSREIGLHPRLLDQPTGDLRAPVPVARLIDTNSYTGIDPNAAIGDGVGIAEFANANFFSEDTGRLRDDGPNYPFPDPSRLVPFVGPIPGTTRARAYFAKGAGDGLPLGGPALAECVLHEAFVIDGVQFPAEIGMCTEEGVWRTTATHMLPRAVAYAAAALDYFFRGRLDVAIAGDPADPNRALLTVTNLSADPLMPQGIVEVFVDDDAGVRQPILGAQLTLTESVVQNAALPPIPIPGSARARRLTVVYRGGLGLERGAVIGRIVPAVLAVEQIFRGPADWMLRTAQGIFPLGLGLGPDEVKWGERDNTLVTETFLAGLDVAFAAYQIARPEGSSDVPLRPDGAVDLVPIGSASLSGPAIDLQTTFSLQRNEHIGQQIALVDRRLTADTSPAQVQYSLAAVVPRDLGSFPFSRAFPLVMRLPDADNQFYGWFVPRAFLNREGAIHAVVQVSLFGLLSEDLACWRHLGDTAGTLSLILIGGRSPCFFFIHHDLPIPFALGSMPFLVNLTNRSLLAKATADAVAVTYSTDRDQWSVDIRDVGLDGSVGCCQWVDGAGIGVNEGGPVAGEFAIRDHVVDLTMTGFHGPAFASVGFANRALVEAPSTAVVPVIPADLSVTPGLSLGVTTQRRFSCPDTTVIEDVDALRGAGAEYMALGKTLCGLAAPAQYTPVRWDPANGRATRLASFELPRSSVVILTGANEAAAMILARNVGSPSTTFLATPTQALVFPGDLSSQYRLLESGVLLNLETFRVHDIDPALTPVRALEPLAAGGPAEGEYHLVRAR